MKVKERSGKVLEMELDAADEKEFIDAWRESFGVEPDLASRRAYETFAEGCARLILAIGPEAAGGFIAAAGMNIFKKYGGELS